MAGRGAYSQHYSTEHGWTRHRTPSNPNSDQPPALLGLLLITALTPGYKDFLEKEPLGTTTQDNLFKDPTNAVQAINAVYDVAAWD